MRCQDETLGKSLCGTQVESEQKISRLVVPSGSNAPIILSNILLAFF